MILVLEHHEKARSVINTLLIWVKISNWNPKWLKYVAIIAHKIDNMSWIIQRYYNVIFIIRLGS